MRWCATEWPIALQPGRTAYTHTHTQMHKYTYMHAHMHMRAHSWTPFGVRGHAEASHHACKRKRVVRACVCVHREHKGAERGAHEETCRTPRVGDQGDDLRSRGMAGQGYERVSTVL